MSKKGFRLEIQKDLTSEERELAEEKCMDFATSKWSDNWATGEYPGPLRRNSLGLQVPTFDEKASLVFRRISKNRRVFGVVRVDTLENMDGSDIELRKYHYPRGVGIWRVRFRVKPDMEFFYERGEVKG